MTSPDPSTEITLAAIRAHLANAEHTLAMADRGDPRVACDAALAELRLAIAAHDQYVRGLSHDLRNTLTAIGGQSQLLERQLTRGTMTPDRLRRALRQIDQATADASAHVRRLSGQ